MEAFERIRDSILRPEETLESARERVREHFFNIAINNSFIRERLFKKKIIQEDPKIDREHHLMRLGRHIRSERGNLMVAIMLGASAGVASYFIHKSRK